MPLQISHLRRWFALGAIGMVLLVAGMYLYARHKVRNALKEVPEKIGLEVQQTAQGFTISRSEQGHTLFKVQASKAIQFKQGGRAELHDVAITLYGRDSTRFDQIYGSDFLYDPQSGDVTAQGEVQIDLEANPQGLAKPDQAVPKELKDPIHLKTTGLTFNQKTGNASTKEKVEFEIPQANGSAIGATYVANTSVLTLESHVNIVFNSTMPARVTATRAAIKKNPQVVVLDLPHVENGAQRSQAEKATIFLRPDNSVDHVLATGDVRVEASGTQHTQVRAAQLDLLMMSHSGSLRTATFSGDVQMESSGAQRAEGTAGRVILNFSGKNVLTTARTEENVKLVAHQTPASGSAAPQDIELTAAAVDFVVADGSRLQRAETSGAAQIAIQPAAADTPQRTLVTAGKFQAHFDNLGQLASVHGAPEARIVTTNPGQHDRVSTSEMLDASFRPGSGIEAIIQQGSVVYVDAERKAWADRARYTPADQVLVLAGSQMVSTVLVQADKSGKVTPVTITSSRLTYADNERKAHFDGAVQAKGGDATITSNQMDVYLKSRGQSAATQAIAATGRVDHIVALGRVLVSQPGRTARGDQLVYTAAEDKFVLTGGPPSIFDAEHGKITGVSLTFFRHDDRVLVEGNDTSPTVTQTRVAR